MTEMPRMHPHAEASYKVVPFEDGSFGVEVRIPESHPTTVTTFASKEAAENWIADHRNRVQSQSQSGRWFRASGAKGRTLPAS